MPKQVLNIGDSCSLLNSLVAKVLLLLSDCPMDMSFSGKGVDPSCTPNYMNYREFM